MKIRINYKLLSDSPFCDENKDLFLSTNYGYKDLIQDIKNGPPSCYLVSGYRGAGKSSFARKIEFELAAQKNGNQESINDKDTQQKEIVFVHTNFSKYHNQTYLLRKLIRGLYLKVKELPSFLSLKKEEANLAVTNRSAELLEQLYEKTFYDTTNSTIATVKKEKITVFNIDILSLAKFILPLLIFIFLILNSIYSYFNVDDILNIGLIIMFAIIGIKGFLNIKVNKSKTKSEQEDFNRKSMYDDEIADHHFLSLLKAFEKKYKVVFVLDELDKVDDSDINKLLNEMKPYLVSGMASFIVVAGQNLFYRYTQSKLEDDALLSTLFAKCIHISLLSREEFQLVFKKLMAKDQPPSTEDEIRLLNAYIDYVIFQAKKVPRKFISLIRQNLSWNGSQAILEIDKSEKDYLIYSQIVDIIDIIDDREIATEGFDEAIRDYFIMQLFLKSQQILSKRDKFSIADILNTSDKELINFQQTPYLNNYIIKLIKEFEKKKLLLPLKNENGMYQVNPKGVRSNSTAVPGSKSIFTQLFELRNVARSVCQNLFPDNNTKPIPFSKILTKLEEHNAIEIEWKNKSDMHQTLDNLDTLVLDANIYGNIEKAISDNNINISKLINGLLEFYGMQKALDFFKDVSFSEVQSRDSKIDLILKSPKSYYSTLLFDFKIRKTGMPFDKKLLIQSLKLINDWATVGNPRPYMFLIVFTYEEFNSLEKFKFQFREAMYDLKEFSQVKDQLKFTPVAINSLHLIDLAFNEFKNQFIENTFHQSLQAQPVPKNFPDRNDHFLDHIFEIKKTDFKIIIKPGTTKFWRFGFRFVKNEKFPPITQGRHHDPSVADVHISVGDIDSAENKTWNFENQLTLTNYHASVIEDQIASLHDYGGQPVTLFVTSNDDTSIVEFRIIVEDRAVGYRKFDLRDFKFCKVFAWADYIHFQLDVNIEAIRKAGNE